jgi:hypothetical protein
MSKRRQALVLGVTAIAGLALAGCQIDTRTPIRTSQILAVAKSGSPEPLNVAIAGVFVAEDWCQDEGAMAVETLSTASVPVMLENCIPVGKHATGQFQLSTTLVRTAGGGDDATILTDTLGGDAARFAVFPHGKRKGLLSVGLFLNLPMIEAGKDKLVAMPVFKRGKDLGQMTYSFTVDITNDLDKPATFHVGNVSVGEDAPADEAVLTIPPGGTDSITLDAATQETLGSQGWVNFFAMDAK